MNLLSRIVLAVVVAVLVTLACVLVGSILVTLKVAIAVAIGAFLKDWAGVFGVLAFLAYFFSGASWVPWRRP